MRWGNFRLTADYNWYFVFQECPPCNPLRHPTRHSFQHPCQYFLFHHALTWGTASITCSCNGTCERLSGIINCNWELQRISLWEIVGNDEINLFLFGSLGNEKIGQRMHHRKLHLGSCQYTKFKERLLFIKESIIFNINIVRISINVWCN